MRFSTIAVSAAGMTIASAAAVTNSTTSAAPGGFASPAQANCQTSYNLCNNAGQTGCDAALTSCKQQCSTTYSACQGAANANQATCASQYSACLGFSPYAANGTNTVTAGAVNGGAIAYTTEIVTALTTVCPGNGAVTVNGQVYTAGPSATTLTITDCPCTITKAVATAPPAATAVGGASPSGTSGNNSANATPVAFTGAGSQLATVGSSLFVAVAGLAYFL